MTNAVPKNNKKKGFEWVTPFPESKDYEYWSKRFKKRQEQYAEAKDVLQNNFELNLPEKSLIAFIGDQHVGGSEVDYDRIEREIQKIVETDNAYLIITGDTVDGYFWGQAAQFEEIEQS